MVCINRHVKFRRGSVLLEKRRQARKYFFGSIRYCRWEDGGWRADVRSARCSNVGPAGMCIYMSAEIDPGALLRISTPNQVSLDKVATVRWVEKLDWNLYRVGLSIH